MKRISFIIPANKNDYEYIGFDASKNNSIFIFPCQYIKIGGENKERVVEAGKSNIQLYNILKREAKKILDAVSKYKYELSTGKTNGENFLYDSINWLIKDFLNNGYYKERRAEIRAASSGKICWQKTMKTNNIFIDEDYLIFNKLFRFKRKIESEQIITEIYKCCLLFAVENLGWVYDVYNVEKSIFDIENNEHRELMIMFLKKNLIGSFVDYKKQLLNHLLKILQGVNDKIGINVLSATDGEFEYVFERLIQNVFGTEKVKNFYPRASYHFKNGSVKEASKLRPDSIMWKKGSTDAGSLGGRYTNFMSTGLEGFIEKHKTEKLDDFVIIDAKFYGFGYSEKDETCSHLLPQSSDVTKQLAYAKFIMDNRILNTNALNNNGEGVSLPKSLIISSAFLLPTSTWAFDADKNQFQKNENFFESVGFAVVGDENTEQKVVVASNKNINVVLDKRVFVCLIDLKKLIDACDKNDELEKEQLKNQFLNCLKSQ